MVLKKLSYTLLITSCLLTQSYASQGAFTLDDEGNTTFHGKVKLTSVNCPALSVEGEIELLNKVSITGDVNLNDHTVTNLKIPTNPTDAATKAYIDTPIKEIRDTFQTLPSSDNVTWDLSKGNVADLTLNTPITSLVINMATATRGTLAVKQDEKGNRSLRLPEEIYRSNTTSLRAPLSTKPQAIDLLSFQKGVNNNIYLVHIANNMSIPAVIQEIFDTIMEPITFPVFKSPQQICRIKLLGGGGGQGLYALNQGSSGAGGFTVYHFNTTNYLGQELKIIVGSGGKGGKQGKPFSKGGYPNGGNGGSTTTGSFWLGAGGGRSEVRIGLPNQSFEDSLSLAIAGGGSGGNGYYYYPAYAYGQGGAGGGEAGQNSYPAHSTGGSQTSGGTSHSSYSKELLLPADKYQGASFIIPADNINTSYWVSGGGDGYYGGGAACGGNIYSASGGSGYINKEFKDFLAKYIDTDSATYAGNYTTIPPLAASDSNFNANGLGVGRQGAQNAAGAIGLNGGNGRVVIDFL